MNPHRMFAYAALLSVLTMGCRPGQPTRPGTVTEDLQDELRRIVESEFPVGGAAVRVIRGNEAFTVFHGTKSLDAFDPPDENTVYEMGSITKTFTATLLADNAVRGAVGLHDALRDYLPADSVTLPSYDGVQISLWHLATHTSGLPQNFSDAYPLPPGVSAYDPFNHIRAEHVYDYLSHYVSLTRAPGTGYAYSNFGAGLLGFVLARVHGTDYESLLKTTVLDVLGMDRSSIHWTEAQRENLAVGYDDRLEAAVSWGSDHVLVGCGSLKSTLKDMTAFLKASMGLLDTDLNDAVALAVTPQFAEYICLNWHLETLDDGQTVTFHGGAAAGHMNFIGFNRETATGAIILYNVNAFRIHEIGFRILQIAAGTGS